MLGRLFASDNLIGMVAGPLIWAAHFHVCYIFTALGCAFGFAGDRWLGVGSVPVTVGIATVIAAGLIAAVGALSYRRWRDAGDPERPDVTERRRFMGLSGLSLSALALVATLWVGLPAMLVQPCPPIG